MKKAWLALLFGSALVLGACGGGSDNAGNEGTSGDSNGGETALNGEELVMSSCSTCHGGQLQGMGNTPGLADLGSRMSEEEILDIILNGTDKGMPGGLLQGEKAEAAAAWLAEQK